MESHVELMQDCRKIAIPIYLSHSLNDSQGGLRSAHLQMVKSSSSLAASAPGKNTSNKVTCKIIGVNDLLRTAVRGLIQTQCDNENWGTQSKKIKILQMFLHLHTNYHIPFQCIIWGLLSSRY